MTAFVNAVLVGLVAFFMGLGVFWYVVGPGALGDGEAQSSGLPTVTDVKAQWGRADADATELLVAFTLRNPGLGVVQTESLAYEVLVGGRVVAQSLEKAPLTAPARTDVPVRFTVRLPHDFAADWLRSYAESAEATAIRLDGQLAVARSSIESIPFEWRSSWQGGFAEALAAGSRNCGAVSTSLCLAATDVSWQETGLHLTITLRNTGSSAVMVENASAKLLLSGDAAAAGLARTQLRIPDDEERKLSVAIPFDDAAIAKWWPGHVGRCEESPGALAIRLAVQDLADDELPINETQPNVEVTSLSWTLPDTTFQTHFICGRSD